MTYNVFGGTLNPNTLLLLRIYHQFATNTYTAVRESYLGCVLRIG